MMLRMILKRPQQPSLWVKLAITRERSFSSQIHESKSKRMWLDAYRSCCFCRIATVEQLQLEQTQTQTHTHTHSQIYRISRAAMPMTFDHTVNFSLMLLILDLRWTAANSQPARDWLGTLSWQLIHQNNMVQSLNQTTIATKTDK